MSFSTNVLHLFSYPKDSVVMKVIISKNQMDIYLRSKTHEQDIIFYTMTI